MMNVWSYIKLCGIPISIGQNILNYVYLIEDFKIVWVFGVAV